MDWRQREKRKLPKWHDDYLELRRVADDLLEQNAHLVKPGIWERFWDAAPAIVVVTVILYALAGLGVIVYVVARSLLETPL